MHEILSKLRTTEISNYFRYFYLRSSTHSLHAIFNAKKKEQELRSKDI